MLKVREISFDDVLKNSDGKIIQTLDSTEYVAIYYSNQLSNADAKTYLEEMEGIQKNHPNLVIIEKRDWEKLHKMITDNYEMIEKKKEQK